VPLLQDHSHLQSTFTITDDQATHIEPSTAKSLEISNQIAITRHTKTQSASQIETVKQLAHPDGEQRPVRQVEQVQIKTFRQETTCPCDRSTLWRGKREPIKKVQE